MKRLTLLLSCVAFALLPAALASAAKPTRELLVAQNEEFPAGVVCAFPVAIDVLENRAKVTTFSDGRQRITGTLKERITNLATGESVDVNASGPGTLTFSADGSTLTIDAQGRSLFTFFPTDPGGAGLFLYTGRVIETIDLVHDVATVVRASGRRTDLCAALS